MFKSLLIISVLAVVVLSKPADEKYTTKYDTLNLDEILNNDRLRNAYFKCLTNKGACTEDAKELKDVLPDALQTDCTKCSDTQRKNAEVVIRYYMDKRKEEWEELKKLYDPDGIYEEKYKDRLKAK
uniref:CSP6 n=1 Tax=Holotrichia parallela TaxID=93412 RepID=A0A0G2YIV3_HOLPA|nr:CSP6 [Holotrichia parallela]